MTIRFIPTKVRKSFFTKKAIWVAGLNQETNKYIKGLVSKDKPEFINAIKRAYKLNKTIVVAINIVPNRDKHRQELLWFNPGMQVKTDLVPIPL